MNTLAKLILLAAVLSAPAMAATTDDPLESAIWSDVRAAHLPGGDVVFDDLVTLVMPTEIENSTDVPLAVRLSPELPSISRPIRLINCAIPRRSVAANMVAWVTAAPYPKSVTEQLFMFAPHS